jgi:hypothetical protein
MQTKRKPANGGKKTAAAVSAKPKPRVWTPMMDKVLEAVDFITNPESELEGMDHEQAVRWMHIVLRRLLTLANLPVRAKDPRSVSREQARAYRWLIRYIEAIAAKSSIKLRKVNAFDPIILWPDGKIW